jgi:hypothetical protein
MGDDKNFQEKLSLKPRKVTVIVLDENKVELMRQETALAIVATTQTTDKPSETPVNLFYVGSAIELNGLLTTVNKAIINFINKTLAIQDKMNKQKPNSKLN